MAHDVNESETINVQVKIEQPTPQLTHLNQKNIIKKHGALQRAVQSS